MTTSTASQQAPRAGQDLHDFPYASIPPEPGWLQRAHRVRHDVWYFSSTPSAPGSHPGRFDLHAPDGTCYFADDVATAAREHLRDEVLDRQEVSEPRALQFRVTAVRSARSGRFADISHGDAVRHSVIRELETMVDPGYEVPRSWARAFHNAGFGGVRYASRFTSEPGPNAWAMFGPAGPRSSGDAAFQRGAVVDGVDACASAGITVLRVPASPAGLTVL